MLPADGIRVYPVLGARDLRKSNDSRSILVSQQLQLDPFAGHLFGFCNRSRTIIKRLCWDRNSFCLWQMRLERHAFRCPMPRFTNGAASKAAWTCPSRDSYDDLKSKTIV